MEHRVVVFALPRPHREGVAVLPAAVQIEAAMLKPEAGATAADKSWALQRDAEDAKQMARDSTARVRSMCIVDLFEGHHFRPEPRQIQFSYAA